MARYYSIGQSVEGVDLLVLELGLNPGTAAPKPNFKYVVRAAELARHRISEVLVRGA